jgi:chaperonin GroES
MDKSPLIPLGDRVVILPDDPPSVKGGLFVPERWRVATDRGVVVAVGLGAFDDDDEREPIELRVGQKVLFSRMRGMQVTFDEKIWLLLRESEILAVLP